MRIFNQPWDGRMEDELWSLLQKNPRFDKVYIAVAFVKRSGVSLLRPALDKFVQAGGILEVVAGIDHQGTSKQGLEALVAIGANVLIFRDNRQNHTFHSKLYLFERTGIEAVGFLGSSNLTAGGLYSNYETNVRYDLDLTNAIELSDYQTLSQVYQTARQMALPLTDTLLDDMEQRGWLGDETVGFAVLPNLRAPSITDSGVIIPSGPSPFPRISIPMIPRRSRTGSKMKPSGSIPPLSVPSSAVTAPVVAAVPPVSTFLMTLQKTDITIGSRSPDVWVPLEARNANPLFWQWPLRYNRVTRNSGTYEECYFRVHITGSSGGSIEDVRFYHYHEKKEFRLNTDRIRSQATVGDLLQIDHVREGLGYEYEITIIPQTSTNYAGLLSLCQKVRAGNSQKVYAYI